MDDRSFLDLPLFDEQHRDLARSLLDWIAANRDSLRAHPSDLDAHCRTVVMKLGEAGWLEHTVPKSWGGASEKLDVRSIAILREALSYESGLADFAFAMQGLGSAPIALYGTEQQRRDWLPGVAAGTKTAAFALSEKAAGSDVASIATTARPDGSEWVINGEKTWISNGGIADFYTVFARTGPAPGAKGLSAFIVDAATPGLQVAERIDLIAPHPLATLRFDNCRIPADDLLGEPGQGFAIAMATLDIFRTTVGAAALGLARRAFDEAAAHASRRHVFGQPLSSFQMTQASLAEMAVAVDAACLLVYRAAWEKDRSKEKVTRESAIAKLYATEAAQQVVDRAVQIFGGEGVRSGGVAESLYREVRALRIYEGASEIQKIVIAREELRRRRNTAAVSHSASD